MTREGILLVVSGPSGVGKGTLCAALRKEILDIEYSVSATTRSPRPGEVHGRDYFFYTRAEFESMVKKAELLEWAVVYNQLYGTPKEYVESVLEEGKDIILEIDIQGARQIKQSYPKGVFVFVAPPSLEELHKRLVQRGTDSTEEIQRRLSLAQEELQRALEYDYLVPNEDLEQAVLNLKSILLAERCRVERIKDKITGFSKRRRSSG